MCKVSVIVPVYNKAQYLKACLASLIKQTLRDIEIICIDDKSTDESLDIIKDYASEDSRIKLIAFEKNRGVSAARNAGIKQASGEFLAFVDADDFVEQGFYEKLYSVSNGFDCVKGEIWDYDTDINSCVLNQVYNLNERIKKTGKPVFFYYGFTSAIYRSTFILENGFHFPEGISYYEDPYFTIALSLKLSAIKIVDGAKYFYRNVSSGLSHNVDEKKKDQLYISIQKILELLKTGDVSDENKYIVVNQLLMMFYSSHPKEGEHDHLLELIKELLHKGAQKRDNKLSVIVPVYNGSKYLQTALDCLTLQSLYDIEIICVNDKSTDNSLEILQDYAKKDDRIRVIDCAVNGGESVARNIGLKAATGHYVAFLDQDDVIDLFFYEKLYDKALETDSDIVKGEVQETDNGVACIRSKKMCLKNPLYFSGDWWTAIYRRSLIMDNSLELPEGYPLGGDIKFLFDACMKCNRVSVVPDVYYYHIVHADSGDSEITPYNKMVSVVKIFQYILNKIDSINLSETDKDCYLFYYYSCICHVYSRINRCIEAKAQRLCIDFIFETYTKCKWKSELLDQLSRKLPLLVRVLKENNKDFFTKLIFNDALSDAFYGCRKEINISDSVPCNIIVPYIDGELIKKYIKDNTFLKAEKSIDYHFVDNRRKKPISVVYNEFLDAYDYKKDSWLVFMHSDFEFLDFPSLILKDLDKSKIYGPIGSKVYINKDKMYVNAQGKVYEKASHNALFQHDLVSVLDNSVDTLDCMCVIVHSSLIEKYKLRFDENTVLDLYVEDFCISAKKNHGLVTEVLKFDCAHHSSYVQEKYYSERYLDQLKYINKKYPDDIFGGTVSPIGGKLLPFMSHSEFLSYLIRQELLTGKKILC